MNYTIPSPLKCEHFGLFEISQPLVDSSKKKSSKFEVEAQMYIISRLEEWNWNGFRRI